MAAVVVFVLSFFIGVGATIISIGLAIGACTLVVYVAAMGVLTFWDWLSGASRRRR